MRAGALDREEALLSAHAPVAAAHAFALRTTNRRGEERSLLVRLGVKLGDRIKIGDATYALRAIETAEPDRTTDIFTLGPRVMVATASLPGARAP